MHIQKAQKFKAFLISHLKANLTSFRKDPSKNVPACLPTPTLKLVLWETQGMKVCKEQFLVWSLEKTSTLVICWQQIKGIVNHLWQSPPPSPSYKYTFIHSLIYTSDNDVAQYYLKNFKKGGRGVVYTQLSKDSDSIYISNSMVTGAS